MLRIEKMESSVIQTPPQNNECVKKIMADWNKMRGNQNLTKVLFFSDAGSHGSVTLDSPNAQSFSEYIGGALHLEIDQDEINHHFETATSSNNSVQIAVLQQELAARATCVMMVGGGLFQQHTLNMYAHSHRGRECYSVRDAHCRSLYIHKIM